MATFDVNADVGEGFPFDEQLMRVITSANVACGFHAGDDATMRQVCGWAAREGVAIGAQVSYRDREGFGRRPMEIAPDPLLADLVEQVEALQRASASVDASVTYLKPHGALYNRVVGDAEQASAVVEAAARYELPLMGLPDAVAVRQARERGLTVVREFFADRAYDDEAHLVPRSVDGSVIEDADVVAERIAALVRDGRVRTITGTWVEAHADSICVHGDTAGALALAERVVASVVEAGGTVGRRT